MLHFEIQLETPAQPDVVRLISALDAYQTPLYPADSTHATDISRLTYADVAFAWRARPAVRQLAVAAFC